ncbi:MULTISPECIES: metallophosphoesterase family protein [unclassified Meridianimarinicoccus]|uniref:metallophosphoesterase family protein n=1 Tax=unclassified Meridianimarinicoccus TaxID=2923344 RepID=UPI001867F38B|nr:DNA repair exonuclease [Fluviibacterium sp. MJW13]
MFRFIHSADLHIDSPLKSLALKDEDLAARVGSASRQALSRITDTCIARDAHALLISGDLFDGDIKSMKAAAFVTGQFERLNDAGIRVFLIRGNHDAESTPSREIEMPPNVTLFTGHGGVVPLPEHGVAIHGVSFSQPSAPDSLLPRFKAPVAGLFNIGLLHTSLAGAAGHDTYAPCSLRELSEHGFDYWALGHIHRRRVHAEAPFIVMPGMPQGRDIGEAGPKSATLVTVEDGDATLEEIPTSVVIFDAVTCDLGQIDDWRDARHAVLDQVRACARHNGEAFLVARVTLTGTTDLAWRIRRDQDLFRDELSQALTGIGGIAIETLEVALSAQPRSGTEGSAGAELAGIMQDLIATPAFEERAVELVRALAGELPPDIRDALGASEDELTALAKTLTAEGADDIAACLAAPQGGSAS